MNIKIATGVILSLVVVGLAGSYLAPREQVSTSDALNTTYLIDGTPVALAGGTFSEPAAPGSAALRTVRVFGEPEEGDLDFDGADDAVVMLTMNAGGSGTFYYVAAFLGTGTNAILLGDRIAPQSVQIKNGVIIANYADRAPGEPMTARPSVGASKYLVLRNNTLVDVSPAAKANLIEVNVRPGDIITSPLTVSGRARGTWYFEASFPVRLVDENGTNIPLTPPYITADAEWMTTEFVPFADTLTFTAPSSGTRGTLILQKDNPSGLPEHDDSLEIPVVFQ